MTFFSSWQLSIHFTSSFVKKRAFILAATQKCNAFIRFHVSISALGEPKSLEANELLAKKMSISCIFYLFSQFSSLKQCIYYIFHYQSLYFVQTMLIMQKKRYRFQCNQFCTWRMLMLNSKETFSTCNATLSDFLVNKRTRSAQVDLYNITLDDGRWVTLSNWFSRS